jgi:hypothetical protein
MVAPDRYQYPQIPNIADLRDKISPSTVGSPSTSALATAVLPGQCQNRVTIVAVVQALEVCDPGTL